MRSDKWEAANSSRTPPEPVQRAVGRWVWSVQIPWLPDLTGDGRTIGGNPLIEAFGRQLAMIRALASAAPEGSSIQLRFVANAPGDEPGGVRILITGAARREADVLELGRILVAVLPAEFPFIACSKSETSEHLETIVTKASQLSQIAEIRRDIDTLDPFIDLEAGQQNYLQPVVLPWTWNAQAMVGSLDLIRDQPGTTVLGVHMEPRRTVSTDLLNFLEVSARSFRRDWAGAGENPLLQTATEKYGRWLRELPRAAVHLRTYVYSTRPLASGLPEAIGVDLTRNWERRLEAPDIGGFRIARPRSQRDFELALELLDCAAPVWDAPDTPELSELMFLFEPVEASIPFRLPVVVRGGLPGITTARLSGLPAGAPRRIHLSQQRIVLGTSLSGGTYELTVEEVNRHILVAGLPGFGKTTTVQTILAQLHDDHRVPFLVIDPAKADYRSMREVCPTLRRIAFTPDHVAFNPFGIPRGSTAATHGGRVLAAFDAALRLSDFQPGVWMILGRALFDAYERSGPDGTPTMRSVYAAVGDVVRRARYGPETSQDVQALLLGRLEFLASGPLGKALMGSPGAGIDWDDLLAQPTVVELNGFAGPQERTLVFALLMAGLVSYREANPTPDRLSHVTVLEEAHRFLSSESGNNEGIRLFADAIAELRGSGEGFIIVDQAPSLLHPSVSKITGSKIAHRIVDADERQRIGTSMLLDAREQEDLARLPTSRAIVFTSEAEGPTVVNIEARTDTRGAPEPASERSLGRRDEIEPLFCLGCRHMCTGEAGLVSLTTHRAAVSALRGVELVDATWRLSNANPAVARCFAARVVADRESNFHRLRRTLDGIDRRISTLIVRNSSKSEA